MGNESIAIVIVTYRNPGLLAGLLENIEWAGRPPCPLYVFQDPSPEADRVEKMEEYSEVCAKHGVWLRTSPFWGCMQGITEYAMANTGEQWIIWVPDDVRFPPGGLWNEYAGAKAYGFPWVGGIQAPYWNAHDLVEMGVMKNREAMLNGWQPDNVPPNAHWNYKGIPRAYINLNGAGFTLNRHLWERMGGFPKCTWRLDEYAGYQGWRLGMPIITLPGPPRVHYFGGSAEHLPKNKLFHTAEAWEEALGKSVADATGEIHSQMAKLKGGLWHEMAKFFEDGGTLV